MTAFTLPRIKASPDASFDYQPTYSTMKKLLLVIILNYAVLTGNTQKLLTQHKSIIVYQFKKMSIILVNEFMLNPAQKFSPRYFELPVKEDVFNVYGPYLQIGLTALTDPFRGPLGSLFVDTSAKDGGIMKLEDLQIRVAHSNNEHFQEWQDLIKFYANNDTTLSLPMTNGSISLKTGKYYFPIRMMLLAHESLTFIIRNKRSNEELIRFRFIGIGEPIAPYLAMWTQDSSSTKSISAFMEHEMSNRGYTLGAIDSFYQYWPGKYSGRLQNEKLYESSKLALYFRKPSAEYPDSSMEYRLLAASLADTVWRKTGHQLFITELKPGNHYRLQIRYQLHPANMVEHSFYVEPKWYQTKSSKIILVVSAALLLALIWALIYKRRVKKEKKKLARLNLEMRAIRSQLNPHFVFNAMSSIQGLINKKDIDAANNYLTEFSRLLRESLNTNDRETIPLSIEIPLLNTYLKLEQLRFHFEYFFSVDDTINTNEVEIPTLLLQPIIENAVKHGVSALNEKGLIKIELKAEGPNLVASVSDNGKGFSGSSAGKGFGLKLTNERIGLLNRGLKKQSVKLTIESAAGKGTIVHLVFLNWL
jgi:hypothetical protein